MSARRPEESEDGEAVRFVHQEQVGGRGEPDRAAHGVVGRPDGFAGGPLERRRERRRREAPQRRAARVAGVHARDDRLVAPDTGTDHGRTAAKYFPIPNRKFKRQFHIDQPWL